MLRNTVFIQPVDDTEDVTTDISDGSSSALELPVDLIQTPGHLILRCPIAGAGIHDIDISLNSDRLTVHKRGEVAEPEKIIRWHHQDCFWGELSRTIELPKAVDPDHTRASLQDGVLVITMPIASHSNTRFIKVRE